MSDILDHPALRAHMGAIGPMAARKMFSAEEAERRTEDAYRTKMY